MIEPIRWLQTNLRETDAALIPGSSSMTSQFNANVLMMSAGGITALYPSKVQYEYVSPYLPKGQDTFGDVLSEAHAAQDPRRQPLGFQQGSQRCLRCPSGVVLQDGGWPAGDIQRALSSLYQWRLVPGRRRLKFSASTRSLRRGRMLF